jgi:hypothetical protein
MEKGPYAKAEMGKIKAQSDQWVTGQGQERQGKKLKLKVGPPPFLHLYYFSPYSTLFYPEGGGSAVLQNINKYLLNYMVSHPKE